VTREHLLEIRLSTSAIGRLIEKGDLVVVHQGVYLVAAHALTWRSRVVAATLLGDGSASHRSAAALWQLPGVEERLVEVTTERRPRATNVIWHRRNVHRRDTTTIDDIRVTGIHRTLMDLGDVVSRDIVEDALDNALARKLTSADWLLRQLDQVGINGRKGARVLADLLNAGSDHAPSWLERRFIRLLGQATLPPYRREFPVQGYRVDFAWPEVSLAVEVHGAKWHKRRLRWAKDLERHNHLTAAGWTLLHYSWDEIKNEPARVLREIVTTYIACSRGLDSRAR
jgi:very-short-patch-repair endonuclease